MVTITDSAAEVRHGHEKKAGSDTDKAKGALIKRYTFAKHGRKGAIKKAHAQHYAIAKATSHLDAGVVAVRGAVKTASIAPKPSAVGSTVPQQPVTPTKDGMLSMSVDTPEQVGMIPIPRPDNLIQQLSVTQKMPAARPGDLGEQRDASGIPMGPASDPAKIQAGVTKSADRLKRISPIYYSEEGDAASELLEPRIIELFTNNPPEDDSELHAIAESWGFDPDVVETAVYKILASFLNEGESSEQDVEMDAEQYLMGVSVEREHTTSPFIAAKIARDHLAEDPQYYTKLKAMEHAEIEMAFQTTPTITDSVTTNTIRSMSNVIGLQISPKDTQGPTLNIKQDARTEELQKRDQPVYKEDPDDDEDEDEEDLDEEGEDHMWVEAFKAGDHRDSEGHTNRWEPKHLDTIAQQYNAKADAKNPERKMAPVVLGHPKDDAPAYGWIDKVKVSGDKLMAHLSELNSGFVQALKEGAYKTRSISLYPDLNIRHLGFLGGVQPAVPGLGPFKFADNGTEAKTYEFNAPAEEDIEVRMLKRENGFFKRLFKNFKIELTTSSHSEPGPQDRVPITRDDNTGIVSPNTERGASMATQEAGAKPIALDASKQDPGAGPAGLVKEAGAITANEDKDKDDIKLKFAELEKKYSELEKKYQEACKNHAEEQKKHEEDERTRSFRDFCESLVSAGRMRPSDVDVHVKNLVLRHKTDSEVKDFAETKATPELDMYKQWLGAQPQVIEFNEIATTRTAKEAQDPTKTAEDKVMSFCEEYIKADPKLTWDKALLKARDEHPSEVAEYLTGTLTK